jgi:hypothetical protein
VEVADDKPGEEGVQTWAEVQVEDTDSESQQVTQQYKELVAAQ